MLAPVTLLADAAGSIGHKSEKDTELDQKLGQLQSFIAVFPQEYAWANLHLLGQPNTFLARAHAWAAG